MAASNFQTTQYAAEHFVESAGAIPFSLTSRKVCLVHYREANEWLLAKGRRNIGETRQNAALREIEEETGYKCWLLPVSLSTRQPSDAVPDQPQHEHRMEHDVCEPFMVTCRELGPSDIKLIWWYMAAVEEDAAAGKGEEAFRPEFFGFEEAVEKLTFELDREVLRKAIEVFKQTFA